MRQLIICLMGLTLFSFFLSCQKEISLEFGEPAKGTLQTDLGECLPKLVAGSYVANKALNDSNFIEVTVNVTTTGPYSIFTDSANGYRFRASGAFTSTGPNTVRLKGTGRPVSDGVHTFTVFFDSSMCDVDVTVLPDGATGGPAAFTLQGAPGACGNFKLNGTYYKDTTLDTRHSIEVQVNVTTVGTYTISTNTVNGYSYSRTGTFGSTGVQTITLTGTGKPAAVGNDNFTVTAGSSTCTFQVAVTTPPVAGGCTPTVQGTYTAGTAATATNRVVITYTYPAAGTYNVSSNTVNGYSFGPQSVTATAGASTTITLNATGTPTAAGTNTFNVDLGNGQTCTFTVTVNPAAPTTNADYFPLTANSYWTYNFPVQSPTDTIRKLNDHAANSPAGVTYRGFRVFDNAGDTAYTEYYRKSGNDYLEYNIADYYSQLTFDSDVFGDILFLKEGLTTNQTWTSAVFSGNVNSQPQSLRYTFTCLDANATVSVNGKTYSNVYKVKMQPQTSNNGGTTWTSETLSWEVWYAKGVGMVQQKASVGANSVTISLRFFRVF